MKIDEDNFSQELMAPFDGNGAAEEASLRKKPREAGADVLPHLRLLWNHRRLIFRAAVCAAVASALIALLIPVRFQSTTRLMPPDSLSSSGLGMMAAMAGRAGADGISGIASDLLGVKSSGALFVGILGSETVQDALIDEFHLQTVYHDSKIEDARKDLGAHTDVSEDRKSGIITISVTDHDPKRAAAIARAYVEELDRLVAQVSTSSARRERVFLEGRLQDVKTDLDVAARNFSDFASKNTAIDIPEQGKAMVEAAAGLQGELIAAQSELSGLRAIYSDQNVRVRSVEARVEELNKKLNELGGAQVGSGKDDNSLYPSIRKLPLLGVTYADLYRQTKIQETVYELLTQQYELAKVEEAKEIPTVKVLDAAIVPTKKTFPPRSVIVILGMMLGTAIGMTWILAKTQWEAVEASDPRKAFAMEVYMTMRMAVPGLRRNAASGNGNSNGKIHGNGNGSNGHYLGNGNGAGKQAESVEEDQSEEVKQGVV